MTRDQSGSPLSQEPEAEGNSPQHQFSFQSSMDLPANLELDWMFRYVSTLPNVRVAEYATSDVRLGWRPHRVVELSVVGKNLHDPRHPEFSTAVEISGKPIDIATILGLTDVRPDGAVILDCRAFGVVGNYYPVAFPDACRRSRTY